MSLNVGIGKDVGLKAVVAKRETDVIGREDDDMAEQKFRLDGKEDGKEGSAVIKPKLDPKDPLRPRRKKARRACFACQRAYLTCSILLSLDKNR
jgi:hypothetical protein